MITQTYIWSHYLICSGEQPRCHYKPIFESSRTKGNQSDALCSSRRTIWNGIIPFVGSTAPGVNAPGVFFTRTLFPIAADAPKQTPADGFLVLFHCFLVQTNVDGPIMIGVTQFDERGVFKASLFVTVPSIGLSVVYECMQIQIPINRFID